MKTFAQQQNLQPADVIITPFSEINLLKHYLVFIETNRYGEDIYAENRAGFGVRFITGTQFAQENSHFSGIRKFTGDNYGRQLAVNRAKSLLGKAYRLVGFNCEDYANFVQNGKSFSNQVAWGTIAAAALGIFALAGAAGNRR